MAAISSTPTASRRKGSPITVSGSATGAALPRVASWVRLLDKQTGQPLLMVNTHFDHRGPEARLQSAHLLTQQIDALVLSEGARLPVILTGDFNCRTSDPPYLAITEADSPDLRLADAAALSETTPEGGDSTSNGFEAINPGAKIDHVFVKDVRAVLSHRIDDPRIDDRFVSDHLPIVVEVAVR